MEEHWYILSLNPEPWATGPLGFNSKTRAPYMGRNQQLDAYKQAVKEELAQKYPHAHKILEPVEVLFLFWRERAQYETSAGRKVTKNEVDTTNMQKATEDALQGILFDNDKNVRDIQSILVDQGPDVVGKVVIRIRPWGGFDNSIIPETMYSEITSAATLTDELDWP